MVSHVHDEASMRIRSVAPLDVTGVVMPRGKVRLGRSRSSKVQNNVVRVSVGGHDLEWFTELQPLARKDAPTMCLALGNVVKEVVATVDSAHQQFAPDANLADESQKVRLVHVITGDGAPTNMAAVKSLLGAMKATPPSSRVTYRVVAFTCASHTSNLVVEVSGEQPTKALLKTTQFERARIVFLFEIGVGVGCLSLPWGVLGWTHVAAHYNEGCHLRKEAEGR